MKLSLLLLSVLFATALSVVPYRGVNQAGLEFDGDWTQFVPQKKAIDYFAARGVNIIRIPFRWDRYQLPDPSTNRPSNNWDNNYFNTLLGLVSYATSKGVIALIDCHNYARYPYGGPTNGNLVYASGSLATTNDFKNFWATVANNPTLKSNSLVWFELMNEPGPNNNVYSTYTSQNAYDLMVAGFTGIRSTGATNMIVVSGTVWSGAHDFTDSSFYGPANSVPFNNGFPSSVIGGYPTGDWSIDVHTYFNVYYAGDTTYCKPQGSTNSDSSINFAAAYAGVTTWARSTGTKLFLGEFGWSQGSSDINNDCHKDGIGLLQYLDSNQWVPGTAVGNNAGQSGPWIGWTYWGAGQAWDPSSVSGQFSLEPSWYYSPCPVALDGNGNCPKKCLPDSATCSYSEKFAVNNVMIPYGWWYAPGATGNTPAPTSSSTSSPAPSTSSTTSTVVQGTSSCPTSQQWQQCGGQGWGGSTCCPTGWSCVPNGNYYSQCLQSSGTPSTSSTTSTTSSTSSTTSSTTSTTATPNTGSSGSASYDQCSGMMNTLSCRVYSADPYASDPNNVASTRSWLCSQQNGKYCANIGSGSFYSSCNPVEQLSNAMNLYYQDWAPSQGTGACGFGGLGAVFTPAAGSACLSSGLHCSSSANQLNFYHCCNSGTYCLSHNNNPESYCGTSKRSVEEK